MDVIVRRSEICGVASPPPSKSYTHRAFIAASLSPRAKITNPLLSGDTLATLHACRKMGAEFVRKGQKLYFRGVSDIECSGYFNFANSGTTLRLFMGLLSLSTSAEYSVLDGDLSLRQRPNRELAVVLNKLGARVRGDEMYRAPVKVKGVIKGGEATIRAISSQFVSSLLFSLPLAVEDSILRVQHVKSRPYIDVTMHVLESSSVEIVRTDNEFHIPSMQRYRLRHFEVPADFSSASYLIAAALIAGKIELRGVYDSRQGDRKIVEIWREMGGSVRWRKEEGILTVSRSELEGVEVDASDIPDLVPTIAALAAVARGTTRIYNAEHLRLKEIDRIEGIERNLRSLGVDVEVRGDEILIRGGKDSFVGVVNSFGDHRMALAFSILGLLGEVRCKNAKVVSVSYPGFFDVLSRLGARVERVL